MRILYCNIYLIGRSGTEVVTIESAQELASRGHEVAVYVYKAGPTADDLRNNGILVIEDLEQMPWKPDVIHANHVIESIHASAAFPYVPQIFVCHDAEAWHSAPPRLCTIRKWLAVDQICAERVKRVNPSSDIVVEILPNAVDLKRYSPRTGLPARPARVLVLSKHGNHVECVLQACQELGVECDCVGPGVGVVVDDLPERLKDYDVVVATARMALEAVAVGCAVVVADGRGVAGMLTTGNYHVWRDNNFGKAILVQDISVAAIREAIGRYDPVDATAVSSTLRSEADLESYIFSLEEKYREAIASSQSDRVNIDTVLRELPEAIRTVLVDNTPGLAGDAHLNDVVLHSIEINSNYAQLAGALEKLEQERQAIQLESKIMLQKLETYDNQLRSARFLLSRLVRVLTNKLFPGAET